MKIIILLGSPGCGKGTQSELLEKEFSFKKLSTGDMLRAISKEDNDLAREIKQVMESGSLVSDELIIKIIEKNIEKYIDGPGIILDGFPRTIAQAQYLKKMLSENEQLSSAEVKAILMSVKDETVVKRISGRFTCAKCLAGYHDIFKPVKVADICDNCGSTEFTRRPDDNPETVKNRLSQYYSDTAPIIDFYRDLKILAEIDGEEEMDLVYNNLVSYIS